MTNRFRRRGSHGGLSDTLISQYKRRMTNQRLVHEVLEARGPLWHGVLLRLLRLLSYEDR